MPKVSSWARALNPTAWALLTFAGLVAVLLIWWLVTAPGRARDETATARVGAAVADGRAKGATDAIGIAEGARTEVQSHETLSRESADVIRSAPGAAQPLDPQLNHAARQRLCLKAAYRNDPQCVQQPDRAKPPG